MSEGKALLIAGLLAVVGIVVVLLAHAGSGGDAGQLVNGSFEIPFSNQTNHCPTDQGSDWVCESAKAGTRIKDATAPAGHWVLKLQSNGTYSGGISQTVSVATGCSYTATAKYKYLSGPAQDFTLTSSDSNLAVKHTSTRDSKWHSIALTNFFVNGTSGGVGSALVPKAYASGGTGGGSLGAITISVLPVEGRKTAVLWDDFKLKQVGCG